MLLAIVAKPNKRDKFEVTPQSVAYLAALVSVSEEVRGRCHARQPRLRSNNSSGSGSGSGSGSVSGSAMGSNDPFNVSDLRLDLHSAGIRHNSTALGGGVGNHQGGGTGVTTTTGTGSLSPIRNYSCASTALLHTSASHNALSSIQGSTLNSPISSGSNNSSTTHLLVPVGGGSCSSQTALIPSLVDSDSPPSGRRQTSWDLLDQNAITQAKQQQQKQQNQSQLPKLSNKQTDLEPKLFLKPSDLSLFLPHAISGHLNAILVIVRKVVSVVNLPIPTILLLAQQQTVVPARQRPRHRQVAPADLSEDPSRVNRIASWIPKF